jgi:ATP-dependent Clp protease ATP-binding subunit ClpA
MMFERFTDGARQVVVQAQADARRLGHSYIGCEHLLLAGAAASEPASAVLREQGVTPERIEAEILRAIGRGRAVDPLGDLDREALAAIGIDLDVVRDRIEAVFGRDALTQACLTRRRGRRPARGKGPVAELMRRRRSRRARRGASTGMASRPMTSRFADQAAGANLPFTPRAKRSLECSLREALALKDNHIGVQHLLLALLAMKDGMVPLILSALGASGESLRAAILARYRKAS